MKYAYRCLKKKVCEIDGIPFEHLPEMKTLQDIMNESLKYRFSHFEGIDKAEYLMQETKRELEILRRNFSREDPHCLYLVAVDEIAQRLLAITTPIIDSLLIEANNVNNSWDRCFEILEDAERVKRLLYQIPDHYLFWLVREEYLVLLRKIPSIERALDNCLQQRIIRAVNCL